MQITPFPLHFRIYGYETRYALFMLFAADGSAVVVRRTEILCFQSTDAGNYVPE